MMKNKKAQSTILMIGMVLFLFFGAILLFTFGIVISKMNEALDINIELGQVNLAEENAKTFGKVNEMVVVNADWWGTSLILGMIMGLFLSSYFLRSKFPKWGIILDIFIILFVFFVALYVSSTYQILLDALATAGETFLEDQTPRTSMFMLNLHIWVAVIGTIMMFLFHSAIPRKTEERITEGGFLQGV